MLTNFFKFGQRNYLNNAIVIADILERINLIFGDVTDFKIKFKKAFNSQAKLILSNEPVEGFIMGEFTVKLVKFYFAYKPVDLPLTDNAININELNYFSLLYEITDAGRSVVQNCFEDIFGPMKESDKVIFALCEIPNTSDINRYMSNNIRPNITISKAEHIGDKRFKYSVELDNTFFGYRYCTVREFNI